VDRGYARITSPEITRKSDQAVWAIGAIAPAGFQPFLEVWPTNSSEPATRKRPIAMPGQAS
jgi:hypothetical protein